MSKQNGGEGGIIINMSSLAGKDTCFVNNNFLLVIWTTEVNLQSIFIIISGLKLKLCLIFFVLLMTLWNFLLHIKRLNCMFTSIILNCDFLSYLTKVLFKHTHTHVYFPRIIVFQWLLWDSWSVIHVKAPLAKWKVQREVKVPLCDFNTNMEF